MAKRMTAQDVLALVAGLPPKERLRLLLVLTRNEFVDLLNEMDLPEQQWPNVRRALLVACGFGA